MAPHFHQPTKKEAPWALLQMRQRRSQGPLMPKAKAPSRSVSQLWHRGTLEGPLLKSSTRDLDTPPLVPSRSPLTQLCPASSLMRTEGAQGPTPDSHHLYGAQGNCCTGRCRLKKDVQLESCELRFIWSKMRTAAQQAACQF